MQMHYYCLVCGYPCLNEPPRSGAGGGSNEICPSCGFEFGFTDDDMGFSYAEWREKWIEGGMEWWSMRRTQPVGWDPETQLRAVEE